METRKVDLLIRFSDQKMQKIPLFESEKYFCDLYCLRSGQDQRIHSHSEPDKIYYVLRGKGPFHIAGEAKALGAAELVIARPGEAHGVTNAATEELVLSGLMT